MKTKAIETKGVYRFRLFTGMVLAMSFSLCAFEYGTYSSLPEKYLGTAEDDEPWLDEDPIPVSFDLPEPPVITDKISRVDKVVEAMDMFNATQDNMITDELPNFDIDLSEVYFPVEYVPVPHFDPVDFPDVYPLFPGGEEERQKFLSKHLIYPQFAVANKIEGVVTVKFVITAKGKIDHNSIEILASPHPVLSKEAIRVVKLMPDWDPGMQRFIKVPVSMKMPIHFSISK